ncbi:uracil-DNA glycosylase family protein [Synechococcus sp. CS-1326]|uniref:uracil-DNA glycosylase family protein n=1 Tax=Synechococcus sp. CS-1326 TaxID=2847978 RepID=UPI00223ACDC2|nr:uracil-DNA glycosylase family protein [Synechococcus sp. CS-1326]MCT0211998.1 uracil-DNA glycosylase family protein [Synechococcus sp. CS-1326]
MAEAGLAINAPQAGASEDVIFVTNAVLCLKQGKKNARVQSSYFANCGRHFQRPLIELVKPKAVATLGVGALNSILKAFDFKRKDSLGKLLKTETTFDLPGGPRLFPMAHPSRIVLNTTRPLELQLKDWQKLGEFLAAT